MNSGKAFVNTIIDTTAVVVLGAAIARAAPAVCKRSSEQEAPKLDFEISHLWRGASFLGISATMVSALYHWDLLPILK